MSTTTTTKQTIIPLGDILTASERITHSPVLPSNIVRDELLSERLEADIWLVDETNKHTGAYKERGAYNALLNIKRRNAAKEAVTASAGNHALGVVFAARELGMTALVFMPDSPEYDFKAQKVLEQGGGSVQLRREGATFDEASDEAMSFASEEGLEFVHPFDNLDVIAGQASLGIEIHQRLPDLDMLVAPVGGGGLLSGVGSAVKYFRSNVDFRGFEPEGAAAMKLSLEEGHCTELEELDPFVDGAAVWRPGRSTYRIFEALNVQVGVVPKALLRRVVTELWEREESPSPELAGALAVAGLHTIREQAKGKKVACIVSGGNLSPERYELEVKTTK